MVSSAHLQSATILVKTDSEKLRKITKFQSHIYETEFNICWPFIIEKCIYTATITQHITL